MDIKGSVAISHLRNLNIGSCPNFGTPHQRWMQHSTYWTYVKATNDCSLPRLQHKSITGPKSHELDGLRWVLAHFEDVSRMIIEEMFAAGVSGRLDRHAEEFKKHRIVPWRGVILYIARTAKYIDDVVDGGDVAKWLDIEALDVAGDVANSVYLTAVAALKEYGYSEKKLRTEEAEMACGASAMDDSNKMLFSMTILCSFQSVLRWRKPKRVWVLYPSSRPLSANGSKTLWIAVVVPSVPLRVKPIRLTMLKIFSMPLIFRPFATVSKSTMTNPLGPSFQ